MTRQQAAEYLGVGLRTLDRLVAKEQLPIVNLGSIRGDGSRSAVRVDRVALDRWVDERRRGGAAS